MSTIVRIGQAYGLQAMKFTLIYDGVLKANGNPTKKQVIRDQIHPQLAELWNNHPCLKVLKSRRYVSIGVGGSAYFEEHHSEPTKEYGPPDLSAPWQRGSSYIDLCEPVTRGGIEFAPLVRERTALRCNLKITFLRHEEPGKILQGGDIDNRLKTLLDALTVPQHPEQVVPTSLNPMYCLLEDDGLITGLEVQTQQLLGPSSGRNHVHLVIEADIRVTDPRGYNQMFLGD